MINGIAYVTVDYKSAYGEERKLIKFEKLTLQINGEKIIFDNPVLFYIKPKNRHPPVFWL